MTLVTRSNSRKHVTERERNIKRGRERKKERERERERESMWDIATFVSET